MIEAYVKITKDKDDPHYQLTVLGNEEECVQMIAHILIHDERGAMAFRTAKKYFKKYGTANGN